MPSSPMTRIALLLLAGLCAASAIASESPKAVERDYDMAPPAPAR